MERGGFGNVARAEVCVKKRVCWSGLARCSLCERSMGGRCRVYGWSGRAGSCRPARDGVLVLDGDGRTFRHEVPQEAPAPAARARRQAEVNSAGAEQREGGQRVPRRDGVGVWVPRDGRVRRVGARAGAACVHVKCSGLGGVRACCAVGCRALRVYADRMGDARVGSAGGHARRGRMDRARWSGGPLGAAQSAAPFGSPVLPKSRFLLPRQQQCRF
jgi:hypothetical protein